MKLREIKPYLFTKWRLDFIPSKRFKRRNTEKEIPLIVSLTTIETRLSKVHLTIKSILAQEQMPTKVVLWLHDRFKGKLPSGLRKLEGDLVEIRFTSHDFPHLKLMHTLEEFPDTAIVTIDDDMMYPSNFLKLLHESHLAYPKDIITNRGRNISFSSEGNLNTYNDWLHIKEQPEDARFVMQLGVYGVLYPPNSLSEKANDVPLLLKLSPKADDLWYKAMAMLKGTTVRLPNENSKPPVLILGSQKVTLKHQNTRKDYNRVQWQQLTDYFNLDTK